MANSVFANGREIACKAGAGKTICAFPDVCFTPPDKVPPTPMGIPIPYPNTGKASDTTGGSKKVKISDKEVGLKNKSCFKKSMGDEAGAAAKKGVVTSKNTGKVYFNAWSMDVKIEGQNVVRHLDLTTNNHASFPGDTPGWPYVDGTAIKSGGKCYGVDMKFSLSPYNKGCDYSKTPHHVIPDRQMKHGTGTKRFKNYTHGSAPCICIKGRNQHSGEHKDYHEIVDSAEFDAYKAIKDSENPKTKYTYEESREKAAESVSKANNLKDPEKKKVEDCIKLQLDNYYKERCKAKDDSPVKASGKKGKRIPKPASASPSTPL